MESWLLHLDSEPIRSHTSGNLKVVVSVRANLMIGT